jgi:hypothetical protein
VISTYLVGARPSSSAGAGGEDMAARGRLEKGIAAVGLGSGENWRRDASLLLGGRRQTVAASARPVCEPTVFVC